MILSELSDPLFTEQENAPQELESPQSQEQGSQEQGSQEQGSQEQGSQDSEVDSEKYLEFEALKKYYLNEKLYKLKSRLDLNGITNNDLDIILKFSNSISYETLLKLTDSIVDIIKIQLKQLEQEVKTHEKSK